MERLIFHVDVNSAFLSWEAVRRISDGNEDIRLIPSAISGDPANRTGVILAKSIPAKQYGIRTGEPVGMALKKCPDLFLARPDFKLYEKNSRAFMDICRRYAPVVEKFSIDECFLDMTGTDKLYPNPIEIAYRIKEEIKKELGFTVNVGAGPNKLLAKMASDMEKPDKVHTLFISQIQEKLWPLPVRELYSVGRATAQKLEKAGCHVIYGLVGLKTHCKLCLVVRREEEGIIRYCHLGTGNYNDKTAKLYTDMGLFTCKDTIGSDVSAIFNCLSGYSKYPAWKKIAAAPTDLREMFVKNIEREEKNALEGKPARIIAKMNSLVDTGIIKALYRASMAGVKIDLIVRGICCLKTGIPTVSENITVRSIVGRFLEHSRIYYFENNGDSKIYLSSADWMNRNLDRRVEVAFPIEDERLKAKVMDIIDITLRDNLKAKIQQPDGTYKSIDKRGARELLSSQMEFYRLAKEEYDEFKKVREDEIFMPVRAEDVE